MTDQLTEEQFEEMKEAYNAIDKNKEGVIPGSKLKLVLRLLGVVLTEAEMIDIIKEIDPSGKETIDFKGFVKAFTRYLKDYPSEEELREAFQVFDKQGTGGITKVELRQVMTYLGKKMSNDDLDIMINVADIDGDGRVNFEEFVMLMRPAK